jgi:hypothetical protein
VTPEVTWAAEPVADPMSEPDAVPVPAAPAFATPDAVLAEVGADDGGSNGQRRGLFGR